MIWPIKAQPRRRELCLLLSHRCNLHCTYCYVDHSRHNLETMPLETAKAAITELFADTAYEEIEISFLGGEPLMEFDTMAEIAQWVMDQEWEKPYIMFATVNGTLLTDEMKEWFTQRKHRFYLCLSYDGKYGAQDMNRSNSEKDIDLDFFVRTWPDQSVKMTVSEDAVAYLARNIIDLHEKNVEIDVSIALGEKQWAPESIRAFRQQLDMLVDYYLERPDLTPVTFLRHDLRGIFVQEDRKRQYCGAGGQFSVMYMDGSKHPCHLLSPLVLSEERMKKAEELDVWHTVIEDLPVCRDCLIRRFCPMCIGMNFKCKNDPRMRDINSCLLVRQQILASCRFQTLLLTRSTRYTEEDKVMAQAVFVLLKALSHLEGGNYSSDAGNVVDAD